MNGATCCLIRACCPPGEQLKALVKEFEQAMQEDASVAVVDARTDARGIAECLAKFTLDHFDLVPKGVGEAIVVGYGPFFKEVKKLGTAP